MKCGALILSATTLAVMLTSRSASAQACYVPNPKPTDKITIRVDKNGTACSASNLTSIAATNSDKGLVDGRYIKFVKPGTYNYILHAIADTDGVCETRLWQPTCSTVIGTAQRYVQSTALKINASTVGTLTTSSYVQKYDSTVPQDTQFGHAWRATSVGTHTYTAVQSASQTSCSFDATYQSGSIALTAVPCQPTFNKTPTGNHNARLPAQTIQVWTALVSSDLATAIADAVSVWNTTLTGPTPTFQVATSDCGSGPSCVHVVHNSSLAGGLCAKTWDYEYDLKTGVITGDVGIGLDALKYLVVHELGHYLGLDHPPMCTDEDSPMTDDVLNADPLCTATDVNPDPQFMDQAMVNENAYGAGSEEICGF
jgi:hypothetical protein